MLVYGEHALDVSQGEKVARVCVCVCVHVLSVF